MMMVIVFMVVMFVSSVQPMMMVSFLLGLTLLYSLWIFEMMGGYWFSYALVMVIVSGVMVLFSYMVSMIPNESFEMYNLGFLGLFFMMMVVVGFCEYGGEVNVFTKNLWSDMLGGYSLFLVVFLLEVMLMVVWLSGVEYGALRV